MSDGVNMAREEWLAARERIARAIRLCAAIPAHRRVDRITRDVFGPCPPVPAPPAWRLRGLGTLGVDADEKRVWVGFPHVAHENLTADEADEMAGALIERARCVRDRCLEDEDVEEGSA